MSKRFYSYTAGRNGRFLLFALFIILAILALGACDETPVVDVVVTEVVTIEGFEEAVTKVVQQTATPTPMTVSQRQPVVLDVGMVGAYPNIDPQKTADENGATLTENLFAGLTNFNNTSNVIEPELAKGWEVSRDGRVWTFHLRDDVYWIRPPENAVVEDTAPEPEIVRPVVAGDVVTAVHRACQSATKTPEAFILFLVVGCEQVYGLTTVSPGDLDAIGVKAIDDYTLQFTLTKPAGYFLTITSLDLLKPVPGELIEEFEDDWQLPENIYTSGPYLLTSGDLSEKRTILQRNAEWPLLRGGNAEVINIYFFDDENGMYELWLDKGLDVAPLPPDNREDFLLENMPRARMVTDQTVFYIAFNFDSGVFRDPNLRRAFSAAIDHEALAQDLYQGRAEALRHLAPPGVVGAPAVDTVGMGYNPDYARQQLAESGYSSCRLMPSIKFTVSSLDLSLRQAELIRDMWVKELDCTEEQIVLEQVQFGTLLANTRPEAGAARPDLWELGWSSYYPDEHNWVNELLHCSDSENRMMRPCSNLDDLMRQASQSIDLQERFDLYRQVENGFFGEGGEAPIVPLYVRGAYLMQQNWLTFTPAHFGGEQYDTYVIDAELKRLERSR
ncbi:MAG: peptide ABC transporter substrate-binding protein [Anaerolineales bacterium]|nr:peptide ABC transporter substrate-binding protein [Anaerolineales bacterium]